MSYLGGKREVRSISSSNNPNPESRRRRVVVLLPWNDTLVGGVKRNAEVNVVCSSNTLPRARNTTVGVLG